VELWADQQKRGRIIDSANIYCNVCKSYQITTRTKIAQIVEVYGHRSSAIEIQIAPDTYI